MALISKKKAVYPVSKALYSFLSTYGREAPIPLSYTDLLRFTDSISLLDDEGNDTLWETVLYPEYERQQLHERLVKIYAQMKTDGNTAVLKHLFIDRIDLCTYGNTQPFRVRIKNQINDNYDYFYVKKADANRIYGLELEHRLSPNRMDYLVFDETLIEAHIEGIPGNTYFEKYLQDEGVNLIRLGKEFVKFTERCFVRLLGDMHSSNFVVQVTEDFDGRLYRIRAIDFDQQCHEGNLRVYMPHFYKQNNPLIELIMQRGIMTPDIRKQYQTEERTLIVHRMKASEKPLKDLLHAMQADILAPQENVITLAQQLAEHYKAKELTHCHSMGKLVQKCLEVVRAQQS